MNESEYGRCVQDGFTGKDIIVEYECDYGMYVLCECGKRANADSDIGAYKYKCECGWVSDDVIDSPRMFIEADRIKNMLGINKCQ